MVPKEHLSCSLNFRLRITVIGVRFGGIIVDSILPYIPKSVHVQPITFRDCMDDNGSPGIFVMKSAYQSPDKRSANFI